MTGTHWLGILSRIAATSPVDLDPLVFGDDPDVSRDPALGSGPDRAADAGTDRLPSERLFPLSDRDQAYIGVRVTGPLQDAPAVALRLASAAIERQVIPIILSHVGVSGFEQFGFRVERISGSSAAECAVRENEIARFWNLAIIIDAQSVAEMH